MIIYSTIHVYHSDQSNIDMLKKTPRYEKSLRSPGMFACLDNYINYYYQYAYFVDGFIACIFAVLKPAGLMYSTLAVLKPLVFNFVMIIAKCT